MEKIQNTTKNTLIALVGNDLYWKIVSYVSENELCGECGSVGTFCTCWTHRPLYLHASADIWDLGLWCNSCQLSDHSYCVCWKVRKLTRCATCDCRLSKMSDLCVTCKNKKHKTHFLKTIEFTQKKNV
jgi:hypothetical protein